MCAAACIASMYASVPRTLLFSSVLGRRDNPALTPLGASPTNNICTLVESSNLIQGALDDSSAPCIDLVANKTYHFTATLAIGRDVIINGRGAILDGQRKVRVLKVTGGNVDISQLNIANGQTGVSCSLCDPWAGTAHIAIHNQCPWPRPYTSIATAESSCGKCDLSAIPASFSCRAWHFKLQLCGPSWAGPPLPQWKKFPDVSAGVCRTQ